MSWGRPWSVVLLASVVLMLSACGGNDDREGRHAPPIATPSVSPTSAPPRASQAALKALRALQASVADLGAVEVSGGTSPNSDNTAPVIGRRHGIANLRTHEFSVVMQLGKADRVEMLRQADMTWTRAPGWYWVKLGYTKQSARAASGKWVTAGADDIKALVDSLDPGAVVQALLALVPDDSVDLAPVRSGALRGNRVLTFRQAGAVQRVFLSRAPRPTLLRITSTSAGATTTVDFVRFPKTFHVQLPNVNDVLQPPRAER